MLNKIFKTLFGDAQPESEKSAPKNPRVARAAAAPLAAVPKASNGIRKLDIDSPKPVNKAPVKLLPIDLVIGLDVGTSCTKAVLGDPEAPAQIAIPLNGGQGLEGYLLPTKVFLRNGIYSLSAAHGADLCSNLKMRLMQSALRKERADPKTVAHLTAFVVITLRLVLDWYDRELAPDRANRTPVWHLNVGLPSKGGTDDEFAKLYDRILRAAVSLVRSDAPTLSLTQVQSALDAPCEGTAIVPHDRIGAFPEAGAQLASLIQSPHSPDGCLMVVDVGAGTLDVSMLKVTTSAAVERCTFHHCKVAPLGVHYLHLARSGISSIDTATGRVMKYLSEDNGVSGIGDGSAEGPQDFIAKCKSTILPVVVGYRKSLKDSFLGFLRPWPDGLPYVLSGGGHRDAFYQELLSVHLVSWLEPVCSEWTRNKLIRKNFPPPRSFSPKHLLADFDRFSVAHGLSLGRDGLMDIRSAQMD